LRQEGLTRCSRPFALAGGGLAVMTAVMGPGALRADSYRLEGTVRRDAHVSVSAQAATRVFGGGEPSTSVARWRVEEGAFLELINEPLVPFAGAQCDLRTTIAIAPSARLALLDVAWLGADTPCVVRSCTQVSVAGRRVVHDRFELRREAGSAALAVGTFVFCDPADATPPGALFAAVDRIESVGVRIGVGKPRCGGVFVRVIAAQPWAARETLHRIRAAALAAANVRGTELLL
jgi:urease accessory protein UreH